MSDADKILTAVALMDRVRTPVIGALVYEIHVPGSGKMMTEPQLDAEMRRLLARVRAELDAHLRLSWPRITATHEELAVFSSPPEISGTTIEANGAATGVFVSLLESVPATAADGEAPNPGELPRPALAG